MYTFRYSKELKEEPMAEKRIGDEFTGLPMSELIGNQDDCLTKAVSELHCPDSVQVPEDAAKSSDKSEE